jgi:squalene-associated FAD-dependent desaturase
MKKIAIIGGGLSGISAAVHLSNNNYEVILIEASPKLGGRAYSFFDSKTSAEIDNGQHIMMSCYHDTLELLELIGGLNEIKIQDRLKVNFIGHNFNKFVFKSNKIFYPFGLLTGILSFKALTVKERLKVVDFFLDLVCCFEEDLTELSVLDWLIKKRQSDNSIKKFWEILCVGIMNSGIKDASAELFAFVLKEIFLRGEESTKIAIPQKGLSKIFAEKAETFLLNNSSEILKSERVTNISKYDNSLVIKTQKRLIQNIEYIISTVPHYSLTRILDKELIGDLDSIQFRYSPIITVHMWLKHNFLEDDFYGLIDSSIHWVFNHGNFISLVISAAFGFSNKSEEEIMKEIICELNKFFPMFSEDLILNFRVLNEKRATFIPDIKSLDVRKKIVSKIQNFYLAGDWTNTGLPGTIEGAVKSGKQAAVNLIDRAQNIS